MVIIVPPMIKFKKVAKPKASFSTVYTIMVEGRPVGRYTQYQVAKDRATELTELTGKLHTVELI